MSPISKSFGAVGPGEKALVTFCLTNRGKKTIRVVGMRAGCICAVPDNLPLAIPAGGKKWISVTINGPRGQAADAKDGAMSIDLLLYTTSYEQPELELTVFGHLRDGKEVPPA